MIAQHARDIMRGTGRRSAPKNTRRQTGKLATPRLASARGYLVELTQRIGERDLAPFYDDQALEQAEQLGEYRWVAHVVGGEGSGEHAGRHCIGSTLYLRPSEVSPAPAGSAH